MQKVKTNSNMEPENIILENVLNSAASNNNIAIKYNNQIDDNDEIV